MTSGRLLARGAVVWCVALSACACRTEADAPARTRTIRIAGSAMAESLAAEYARALPDLQVRMVAMPSPLGVVDAIQRGDVDLGVAFADSVYSAYAAETEAAPGHPDSLRAISALRIAPLLLLAGAGSGIRTIADLPGHSVRTGGSPQPYDQRFRAWKGLSLGDSSTATRVTALSGLVLLAFRMNPDSVRGRLMAQADAVNELIAGTLDAVFTTINDSDKFVFDSTSHGARLIPMEGPAIERLRREYSFIRPVSIPAATYPGQTETLHTVGVDLVLICRRDLDEQLVYDLTKVYFNALPKVSPERAPLRTMDLEQAPATPIPLHDGAARFYREWELFR